MSGLPLATALIAGLTHALEADHLAAVTTFVSRRPHPIRAMGFGVRWGIAHSAALLLLGGALVMLGVELPQSLVQWLEAGVGAMLVGLGAWAAAGAAIRIPRDPGDGAPHRHSRGDRRGRAAAAGGGTAWVGAAHGVAGTAGFLALVPALLLASPWSAGGYLVLFGVGTVLAMGTYGLLAGLLFDRAGARVPTLARAMRLLTGIASIGIGAAWVVGAVG